MWPVITCIKFLNSPFLMSTVPFLYDLATQPVRPGVRDWILLYVTPWGHTFLTALIISGVTFDGHFPLAFTSPSVLHPYVCVARTYIPGHTHLGVTQEVSLTLWGGSNPYTRSKSLGSNFGITSGNWYLWLLDNLNFEIYSRLHLFEQAPLCISCSIQSTFTD